MKTYILTEEQRQLVEAHIYLVRRVIANVVRQPHQKGALSYEDLLQTGYMALCEAAVDFDTSRDTPFKAFAYVVIRNDLFNVLNRAQRQYTVSLIEEIPAVCDETLTETQSYQSLVSAARRMRSQTARHGVISLIMLASGYAIRDIGRNFGVSARHVTSWIEEARSILMNDARFLNELGHSLYIVDLISA